MKVGDIQYPGSLIYASKHGSYPGCGTDLVEMDELQKWAEKHDRMLVVDLIPFAASGQVLVVYTRELSEDDRELLTQFQEDWAEFKAKKEEGREASRLLQEMQAKENQEAAEKLVAETNRLAIIGRQVEEWRAKALEKGGKKTVHKLNEALKRGEEVE